MFTLKAPHSVVTEIKKSRFITHAAPVASSEEAMAFIAAVTDPSATHNCWSYKIGTEYRFNDDGEPGGTAGKPILSAIAGSGVDCVVVVVTRFFGGIKLGAGGLVRAYSGAAATCLGQSEKMEIVLKKECTFDIPFDFLGCIYPLFEKHNAVKLSETFMTSAVRFAISLPATEMCSFEAALMDATSGNAQFIRTS